MAVRPLSRPTKLAVTAMLLALSPAGVAISARAVTDVVGVASAPGLIGWSTGGFAPDPPPPPLPDWCTPDNPDPACHPPPPPHHRPHAGLL
jgi:hypothetical protein